MPEPYPKEFRDDLVNLAHSREPGQTSTRIVADLGVVGSSLRKWMRAADVEDALKPGTTSSENAELREAKKRIRRR